jgi:hypothetical protein
VPPLLLQPAPPLPASVSSALAARSSAPPSIPVTQKPSAAAKSGSRWWLWLFLLVGVAAYFALRTY